MALSRQELDYIIKRVAEIIQQKKGYEKEQWQEFLEMCNELSMNEDKYFKVISGELNLNKRYIRLIDYWKKKKNYKKALLIAEEAKDEIEDYNYLKQINKFLEERYLKNKDESKLAGVYLSDFNCKPSRELYKKIKRITTKLGYWNRVKYMVEPKLRETD